MPSVPELRLGTSSWSTPSWVGAFYPRGTVSGDYLQHYARRFRSVEIDSTWYGAPSPRTLESWLRKTGDDFTFCAKVPRAITHEKVLRHCQADLDHFVSVMRGLGSKLGVLLLQFPNFSGELFPSGEAFVARLAPFLALLPEDVRFAVEVRNKTWLREPLFEVLRQHRVALAWIDYPHMPGARLYSRLSGAITTDFLYVRWLGDRHRMEAITQTWDRLICDRIPDLRIWKEVLQGVPSQVDRVYGYFSNHYGGCAFRNADQFQNLWDGLPPDVQSEAVSSPAPDCTGQLILLDPEVTEPR